jgi:hypothetical protein
MDEIYGKSWSATLFSLLGNTPTCNSAPWHGYDRVAFSSNFSNDRDGPKARHKRSRTDTSFPPSWKFVIVQTILRYVIWRWQYAGSTSGGAW